MSRLIPKKTVPKSRPPLEASRFVEFWNPDVKVRGFWLDTNHPITVDVPIFPHGYYPKLTDTEHEVRANITHRRVEVPSVAELQRHGIDVFQAIFIADVIVKERHIKNYNFFRGDFPAAMKMFANANKALLIFPANDMPSARLVRKEVLNFWRQLFTPLFIKGKHYTSGRMSMYMVAPSGALNKFKTALNLEAEDITGDILQEWYPGADRSRFPRKRGPRPKLTNRETDEVLALVDEASERMGQLLPILRSKMDIEPNSKADRELEAYVTAPETAQSLIRDTQNGKTPHTIRLWVQQKFLPKVAEIAKAEGAYAAEIGLRHVLGFAFQLTVASVIGNIFQQIKTSKFGEKHFPGMAVEPGVFRTEPYAGMRFTYTPRGAVDVRTDKRRAKVYEYLYGAIWRYFETDTIPIEHFVDITFTSSGTSLRWNQAKFDHYVRTKGVKAPDWAKDPETLARLQDITANVQTQLNGLSLFDLDAGM